MESQSQPQPYNPFSGALLLPAFGLIIQAKVTYTHWYCDHHALARSSVDGTPDVMHCVLDDEIANVLHAMQIDSSLELSRIRGSREVIQLVVLAPENITKNRLMTVEVIELPQVLPSEMIMTMKGMTYPPISSIIKQKTGVTHHF